MISKQLLSAFGLSFRANPGSNTPSNTVGAIRIPEPLPVRPFRFPASCVLSRARHPAWLDSSFRPHEVSPVLQKSGRRPWHRGANGYADPQPPAAGRLGGRTGFLCPIRLPDYWDFSVPD